MAPLASHGRSRSHQGGKFEEEVLMRMSPSLFQQVARPLPVKYILFDNRRKQCTGMHMEVCFFPFSTVELAP